MCVCVCVCVCVRVTHLLVEAPEEASAEQSRQEHDEVRVDQVEVLQKKQVSVELAKDQDQDQLSRKISRSLEQCIFLVNVTVQESRGECGLKSGSIPCTLDSAAVTPTEPKPR